MLVVDTWRQRQQQETQSQTDFEETLRKLKSRARKRGVPPHVISDWEKKERRKYARDVEAWGTTVETDWQTNITEWRKAWRPPSYTEMAIKGLQDVSEGISQFWGNLLGWSEEERQKYHKGERMRKYDPSAWIMAHYPEFAVGAFGAVERLSYVPASLLGYKTPRAPPTMVSSVSSQAFGAGLTALGFTEWGKSLVEGGREEWTLMKEEYGDPYMAGTLIGDVYLSALTGKAIGKGFSWVKSGVIKHTPLTIRKAIYYGIKSPITTWKFKHVDLPLKLAVKQSRLYGLYLTGKVKTHALTLKLSSLKWTLPKSIQKTMWGREFALRKIEYAFPWVTKKASTVGLMEKAYGMPFFTHQTLRRATIAKDWLRIYKTEWLAVQKKIEGQLAWTLGVSPAYGVSAPEVAKRLTMFEKLEQAEKIDVWKLEKKISMRIRKGKLTSEYVTTGARATGKKTTFTYRGAFEFEQSVRRETASRLFIPKHKATQFFKV